jgi:hypothetical protein
LENRNKNFVIIVEIVKTVFIIQRDQNIQVLRITESEKHGSFKAIFFNCIIHIILKGCLKILREFTFLFRNTKKIILCTIQI